MDYVCYLSNDSVRVRCTSGLLLAELAALGATAVSRGIDIPFGSRQELATILTRLQQLQLPFADEMAGWPPAAVFAQLRDEGLVHGSIVAVSWSAPHQPVLRVA